MIPTRPVIKTAKPLIVPVFLPHAGCPHRCVFCNQSAITGEKPGLPTAHALRAQVETFLAFKRPSRGTVQIAFYGGNFLGLPETAIRALLREAEALIRSGKADSIRFSTRPDTVTAKRLQLLDHLPVAAIELGVQSLHDRVLELSKRGHTAQAVVEAVALLKQQNYAVGLQLMLGLPGDDESRALLSAEKTAALGPAFVRLYPTLVLEGSPLARLYREGRYRPLSLAAAVSLAARMYRIFELRAITVVRMGLQASEGLQAEAALAAGPFHPAFGHLVHCELFLEKARNLIAQARRPAAISLCVHPHSLSRLQGISNANLKILEREFHLRSIALCTDPSLAPNELRLR